MKQFTKKLYKRPHAAPAAASDRTNGVTISCPKTLLTGTKIPITIATLASTSLTALLYLFEGLHVVELRELPSDGVYKWWSAHS